MPKQPKQPSEPQRMPLSAFSRAFRPLHDRVALRRHQKDQMAPGSKVLYRPEQKLKNSDRADVLAVGSSCKQGLKPGDVVVVSTFADGDRVYDGERLMVVPESDVMAVLEG